MGNITGKANKVTRLKEESEESKRAREVEEKRKWLECNTFSELPPEGRKAFKNYAKEKQFNADARRLEFWFESSEVEPLSGFLSTYLSDGENQLPDVDPDDNTDEVVESAKLIDSYVSELKDRMKPSLNNLFRKFKDFLIEEISK